MNPIIITKQLGKVVKDGEHKRWILSDINLSLSQGEFILINGSTGSGKSTLLHILGGLMKPDHGSFMVNNMEMDALNDTELSHYRKKVVGFVFQSFFLLPGMNALQNVAYPLQLAGVGKEEREEVAFSHLKKVGMEQHIHKTPKQLSGGQKQRVAIARSIVHDPLIILADEPTGNLDSESKKDVWSLFIKLKMEGATIIVVSHEPSQLIPADLIIRIVDGRIDRVHEAT